jgi:predicted RNase H-like HicB family nuclease
MKVLPYQGNAPLGRAIEFTGYRRLYVFIAVSGVSDVMVEIKGKKFTVILREEPEGGYSAQCLELPGAISEGKNRKEALANIKEAVEGYLESFPEVSQLKCRKELVEITV